MSESLEGKFQFEMSRRNNTREFSRTKGYSSASAYFDLAEEDPNIFPTAFREDEVPKSLALSEKLKAKGVTCLITLEEMALISSSGVPDKYNIDKAGDSFIAAYFVDDVPKKLQPKIGIDPVKNIKLAMGPEVNKENQKFAEQTFSKGLDYVNQIAYRYALMRAMVNGLGQNSFEETPRRPLTPQQRSLAESEMTFNPAVVSQLGKSIEEISDLVGHFNQVYLKQHSFVFDDFVSLIRRLAVTENQSAFRGILQQKGLKFWQSKFFGNYYSGQLNFLKGVLEKNA